MVAEVEQMTKTAMSNQSSSGSSLFDGSDDLNTPPPLFAWFGQTAESVLDPLPLEKVNGLVLTHDGTEASYTLVLGVQPSSMDFLRSFKAHAVNKQHDVTMDLTLANDGTSELMFSGSQANNTAWQCGVNGMHTFGRWAVFSNPMTSTIELRLKWEDVELGGSAVIPIRPGLYIGGECFYSIFRSQPVQGDVGLTILYPNLFQTTVRSKDSFKKLEFLHAHRFEFRSAFLGAEYNRLTSETIVRAATAMGESTVLKGSVSTAGTIRTSVINFFPSSKNPASAICLTAQFATNRLRGNVDQVGISLWWSL